MIIRRLILSVVLLLLASTTTLVVLGLDDTARSALLDRLPPPPNTTTPSSVPPAEPSTQPTSDPVDRPRPTPTAPSVQPRNTGTARPGPQATPSPPAQRKPSTPPGQSKVVYLTFDDGPSPYTPRVLQILRDTGSTATFFQLGANTPGHDQLTAAIRAQGSTIGNHSYDHPDLTRLSASQLRRQIRRGPTSTCFRPPYGATNASVRAAIRRAGARQVLWTVDTRDWTQPGVKKLARIGTSKQIRPGSIILMHDGGGNRDQTVAALPALINHLHGRGLQVRALPGCR